MWVSELDGDSWLLHKELQGGHAVGTGHRGVIGGNSHLSGSGRLSLTDCAPVPGWGGGAGLGTQAVVILVSHLAIPQYVLLVFCATESVCQGKQCYSDGEGEAEDCRGVISFQSVW